MTGKGHTYVGFAISTYPAGMFFEDNVFLSFMVVVACVLGSTAPDWLEIPIPTKDKATGKRTGSRRLIKHRTWTHVVSWWVALVVFSYSVSTGVVPAVILDLELPFLKEISAVSFGFTFGALFHVLCDIPNKTHVPLFFPYDGYKLNFWKSDANERVVACLAVMLVMYFYMKGYSPPLYTELVGYL